MIPTNDVFSSNHYITAMNTKAFTLSFFSSIMQKCHSILAQWKDLLCWCLVIWRTHNIWTHKNFIVSFEIATKAEGRQTA